MTSARLLSFGQAAYGQKIRAGLMGSPAREAAGARVDRIVAWHDGERVAHCRGSAWVCTHPVPTGHSGRPCASRHTFPLSGLASRWPSAGGRRVGAAASASPPGGRVRTRRGASGAGVWALAGGGCLSPRSSRQAWHGVSMAQRGVSHTAAARALRRRPRDGPRARPSLPTHGGARELGHGLVASQEPRPRRDPMVLLAPDQRPRHPPRRPAAPGNAARGCRRRAPRPRTRPRGEGAWHMSGAAWC